MVTETKWFTPEIDTATPSGTFHVVHYLDACEVIDLEPIMELFPGRRIVYVMTGCTRVHPQSYYWAPAWQEGERAADQDLEAGRTRRFSSIEDAIRYLHGEWA